MNTVICPPCGYDDTNTTFVVFCPEKLAIVLVSGIITTNLGKTATHTEIAGREKTDTSLQNMPFSLTGEGHFFYFKFREQRISKTFYNNRIGQFSTKF